MNKPHLLGLFLLCLITVTAGDMQRRQVVAPLWLQQHGPLARTQNAQVRVTPLNLKETALIRANIQRAVNDGTYVVAASPQQFVAALGQRVPVPSRISAFPAWG